MTPPRAWVVEHHRGPAADLHGLPMPDPVEPALWILDATDRALVLGSAQPGEHVDPDVLHAAGIELVRRRSGGGAVLVVPGASVWVDLLVPRGHALWQDDVGRAMHWVGDLWQRALAGLGVDTVVHRGPMVRSEWSGHVCFAGLGPGEVLDPAGRKVVGISQRRTRAGARFQTVADLVPSGAGAIAPLLQLGDDEREELAASLGGSTAPLAVERDALLDALVAALPA